MTAKAARIETDAERAFREAGDGLTRLANEPAWRRKALDAFSAAGLPDKRREDFHFTDIRAKLSKAYPRNSLRLFWSDEGLADHARDLRSVLGDQQAAIIPIVNGFANGDWRAPEDVDAGEPLSALNALFAVGGARVGVPAGVQQTIVIDHILEAMEGRSNHPLHVIEVGANAKLTLIELHQSGGDHLSNVHADISVGDGAEVRHIKLLAEDGAVHFSGANVRIARGASYEAVVLVAAPRLARSAAKIRFEGAGGTANMKGVILARGEEHLDLNVRADHDAPGCSSELEARLVAVDKARAVAQCLVRVSPKAGGTDARQMIKGLILGERAEIDAKPELEILNDNVKAAHGTALGDLDPEAIFYLRARGVPEAQARALLIEAFLEELIGQIAHEGARTLVREKVQAWLSASLKGGGHA